MKARLVTILISALAGVLCASAQGEETYKWNEKGVWPESPKAATIREVTSPRPALLTGAAEFSVPLYTFEADGLSLPFEFRYHSNGIRVDDDPCPWGYGWTLSPSIRISRRIVGRPDGVFKSVADTDKEVLSHGECYHAMTDSFIDYAVAEPRKYPDFYTDPAPDIFTVQLPGKQFTVIFRPLGGGKYEAVTSNNDEYRIEPDALLTSFTVTDPRGYTYSFGVQGEYSMSRVFCTEWLPDAIICPTGRKIKFSYIDCNSATHNMPEQQPQSYTIIHGSSNPPAGGKVAFTHPDFHGGKHLSAIESEGEKVSIEYEGAREGHRCIKNLVASIDGTEVRRADFTYDPEHKLLQGISTGEGDYTFEYDSHTFNEGSGRDWWGFSNGKPGWGSPSVEADLNSLLGLEQFGNISYRGADRSVDADHMQARMLVKATYPTGGSARWEYEPHRFNPVGPSTTAGISFEKIDSLSTGGGVRVKRISLYENDGDPNPQTVEYYYGENRDGKAVCKAAPTLDTFVDAYELIEFCQAGSPGNHQSNPFFRISSRLTINHNSSYMQYRFGETPIWYSCVEEVATEGKTVTRFEDLIDSDDVHISGTDFVTWVSKSFHAFSDGPQMTSRVTYKSDVDSYREVSRETLEYDTDNAGECLGFHVRRLVHSSTQIPSGPDFTATDRVSYHKDYIYPSEWLHGDFISDDRENGNHYFHLDNSHYSEGSYYSSRRYSMLAMRERLASKTVTERRENGDYTTTQTFGYVPGTGIIKAETSTAGSGSVNLSFRYADALKGATESGMVAANMVGVAIGETSTYGKAKVTSRAAMTKAGSTYRPEQTFVRRGTAPESGGSRYTWNSRGRLLSATDSAGVKTTYTWDSYNRYPVKMQTAHLVSTAEWKPGVGVSALTTPDGVKTTFAYDAAGRLISCGIDGHGTLKTWEYHISQDGDSYISEKTLQAATALSTSPYTRVNYDGLGRTASSVTAIAGGKGYIYTATATTYDAMGRPERVYSPAAVGSDAPDAAEVAAAAATFYGDDKPYALTRYEASQRREATSMLKAGKAWHSAGKETRVRKLVNDGGDYRCAHYELGSDGSLTHRGNYRKGTLTVEETTDEDGITEAVFTDIRGKCVLRQRGDTRTYYVYDDYGDLRYILPPDIADGTLSEADLSESAYVYRYDSRGRMVYSKIPGCGPSRYIYDSAGRLVAETDADLGPKWRMHFYDCAGREVVVAEGTLTPQQQTSIAEARAVVKTGSFSFEDLGYSIDFDMPADASLRHVSYYDDYSGQIGLYDGDAVGSHSTAPGLLTGIYAWSDDGTGMQEEYRYDALGRRVLTMFNYPAHSIKRTTVYDYAGHVVRQTDLLHDKSPQARPDHTLERRMSYDSGGRLSIERSSLDGGGTVVTAYSYDGAGRMSRTSTGVSDEGMSSLTMSDATETARRTYSYDVHGWPTAIETRLPLHAVVTDSLVDLTGRESLSLPFYGDLTATIPSVDNALDLRSSKYTETIHYADGTYPRYNGTPSARGLTQGGRYDYRYDHLDRLVAAEYTAPTGKQSADFSTSYAYDILARPVKLHRRGVIKVEGGTEAFGDLDKMTLTYDGATLASVSSDISGESGYEYYGRTGWSRGTYVTRATFAYNDAGRLVKDNARMIGTIRYNTLGLPTLFSTAESGPERAPRKERVYDALGRKRRQREVEFIRGVETVTSERRYLEIFTTNADTLERVDFSGGYFDGTGKAHFLFTDWQGNVTISTDAQGNIEQHTGYYPYGEPWREPSGQRQTLYAGKERQSGQAAGDFDFGPRDYSATFGNWYGWDRKASDYPWWSPWAYCGGNPVKNVDPSGDLVYVFGNYAVDYIVELQKAVGPSLQLGIEKSGRLYYTRPDSKIKLSDNAHALVTAINNEDIVVKIETRDNGMTSTNKLFVGGAFMGNKVNVDSYGNRQAIGYQEVNVGVLSNMSFVHGLQGVDALHELTEAYEGAKDALQNSDVNQGVDRSNYEQSHDAAVPQTGEVYETFYDRYGFILTPLYKGHIPPKTVKAIYHVISKDNQKVILQIVD